MNTTQTPTGNTQQAGSQRMGGREQLAMDTFNRHVHAFRCADLDKVLADFANDAIVITPDGVFEGRNGIRTVYAGLLSEFGNIDAGDSPGIFLDALHVRDNTLFITWHAESVHHRFDFGMDTFVIEGAKIKRQSIAYLPPQPNT